MNIFATKSCNRNIAPRFILVFLVGFVFPFANSAPAVNANVKDIDTYMACVNQALKDDKAADISKAVQCVPAGCKLALTMSTRSAQAACSLGGCQLPRVILDCPGPKNDLRFRPSFLLCPIDSKAGGGLFGTDRVELGEDTEKVKGNNGKMKMADVPIPPNAAFAGIKLADVLSIKGNDKGCNDGCHKEADPGKLNSDPILSEPIDTFGVFRKTNLLPLVIDTNEPNYTDKVNPKGKGTDGKELKKQTLAEVCDCIKNNKDAIKMDANSDKLDAGDRNPNLDVNILLALCNNLADYRKLHACGKAADPSTATACSGIQGGGKFLIGSGPNQGAVSMVRFSLSGQTQLDDPNTYRFTDIAGNLSGFNYLNSVMVDSANFSSLKVSLIAGNIMEVTGQAFALVNGSMASINVYGFNNGSDFTFEIRDAISGAFLVGGNGEAGRAAVKFTPDVP